jgi:hypothetical protein
LIDLPFVKYILSDLAYAPQPVGKPFDDDAHREIRAEFAAAVPIDPRGGVEQIRRIRDDEIDWLLDRSERVSLPKAYLWDCGLPARAQKKSRVETLPFLVVTD